MWQRSARKWHPVFVRPADVQRLRPVRIRLQVEANLSAGAELELEPARLDAAERLQYVIVEEFLVVVEGRRHRGRASTCPQSRSEATAAQDRLGSWG